MANSGGNQTKQTSTSTQQQVGVGNNNAGIVLGAITTKGGNVSSKGSKAKGSGASAPGIAGTGISPAAEKNGNQNGGGNVNVNIQSTVTNADASVAEAAIQGAIASEQLALEANAAVTGGALTLSGANLTAGENLAALAVNPGTASQLIDAANQPSGDQLTVNKNYVLIGLAAIGLLISLYGH